MDYEKDVLLEFENKGLEKCRYFASFIILFIFYIIYLLFFLSFELNLKLQIRKNINWEINFFIAALPAIGIILLVKKKKIGWAICVFYNLFTGLFRQIAFFQPFLKNNFRYFDAVDGLEIFIEFLIPFALVAMLISRDFRYYLKISTPDLRDTLIISSVLSLFIIVMVLGS